MFFPYYVDLPKIYNPIAPIEIVLNPKNSFNFSRTLYFKDIKDLIIFQLENGNCTIKNDGNLSNFIDENPPLFNDICNTLKVIKENFSPDQKTFLELFVDEDDVKNSKYNEVFLNIILEDCSDECISKFNRVNNWFVENIYKFRQKLNINMTFK